jgi:1-acyl-sn-glycerol-3-phosphate acyltransferase
MRWNPFSQAVPKLSTAKDQAATSSISPWLAPLAYWLGNRLLMPFYFHRAQVLGRENLPTSGAVILAPTHRSRWDSIIIPFAAGRTVTGRDLHFMVAVNEVQGLQGWFIRRLGGFSIDPEQPAIASLRHSIDILAQGQTLVIFPEGGELSDNRQAGVNQLHPGLARLALQAETLNPGLGTKVVPISVHYHPQIPRWGCSVNIQIGEPMHVSDYIDNGLKKGAKRLTEDLAEALRSLSFAQGEPGTSAPLSQSPLENVDLLCA